jgi:hypothetical protein
VATINFWNKWAFTRMRPPAVPTIHKCTSVSSRWNLLNPTLGSWNQGTQKSRNESDVVEGLQRKAQGHSRLPTPISPIYVNTHPVIKRARPLNRSVRMSPFPCLVDCRSPCWFHDGCTLDTCERGLRRGLERGGTTRGRDECPRVPSARSWLQEEIGFTGTSDSFSCSTPVSDLRISLLSCIRCTETFG